LSTQSVIDRLTLSVGAYTDPDREPVQSDVSNIAPIQVLGLDSSTPVREGWDQELVLRKGSLVLSGSGQKPSWAQPAFLKMQELVNLDPGWDSHDAVPVRSDAILAAVAILSETMASNTKTPWIVPTVHGGIQMEWHKSQVDLEIEIKPNRTVSVFYVNEQDGRQLDEPFDTAQGQGILTPTHSDRLVHLSNTIS